MIDETTDIGNIQMLIIYISYWDKNCYWSSLYNSIKKIEVFYKSLLCVFRSVIMNLGCLLIFRDVCIMINIIRNFTFFYNVSKIDIFISRTLVRRYVFAIDVDDFSFIEFTFWDVDVVIPLEGKIYLIPCFIFKQNYLKFIVF